MSRCHSNGSKVGICAYDTLDWRGRVGGSGHRALVLRSMVARRRLEIAGGRGDSGGSARLQGWRPRCQASCRGREEGQAGRRSRHLRGAGTGEPGKAVASEARRRRSGVAPCPQRPSQRGNRRRQGSRGCGQGPVRSVSRWLARGRETPHGERVGNRRGRVQAGEPGVGTRRGAIPGPFGVQGRV